MTSADRLDVLDRGPAEGQTLPGRSRLVTHFNFVKLPHTVFALPFALVGATLASYVRPVSPLTAVWVIVAFTSARFAAMGFNRIADREIDARNPRTLSRELPSGAMAMREAVIAVSLAALIFVLAAAKINRLCLLLAPVALAWVFFYSFTKRFTRWSHLVLGLGLAIAPVGGYLAVTGSWSRPWWLLGALAAAVATWVGGFDILYALQDIDFDRRNALHSIPAARGESEAILISRVLHGLTVLGLGLAGWATGVGAIYFAGVTIVAALLVYEHLLVTPGDLSRLNAAFFTMNGVISLVFFGFVLAERVIS